MIRGDTVRIHAVVWTAYGELNFEKVHDPIGSGIKKILYRMPVGSLYGVFLGWTYRATGHYNSGNPGDYRFVDDLPEPPSLMIDKRHKVGNVMVLGIETNELSRWVEPSQVLPEDMERVREFGFWE